MVEERVLTDSGSYPLATDRLTKAAAVLKDLRTEINQKRDSHDSSCSALASVVFRARRSIPLAAGAYRKADNPREKLNYARILGVLGDDTGLSMLLEALKGQKTWGKGYGLTSHRETHNTFAEIDRLVTALGFTRSLKALPALVEKLKLLDGRSPLSHVKAICLALPVNRDSSLAGPLAELLDKPGMSGHARPAEYYGLRAEGATPQRRAEFFATAGPGKATFNSVLRPRPGKEEKTCPAPGGWRGPNDVWNGN